MTKGTEQGISKEQERTLTRLREMIQANKEVPSIRALAAADGTSPAACRKKLVQLEAKGKVRKLSNGAYGLPSRTEEVIAKIDLAQTYLADGALETGRKVLAEALELLLQG